MAERLFQLQLCRSPCGERGLKLSCLSGIQYLPQGRSPCGERGLKYGNIGVTTTQQMRRSPCGERGLKSAELLKAIVNPCRSPCGERGLKLRGKHSQ